MLNKVQLIGRLGADPEIKHLDGGATLARMRMATSERYKDKNGETQEQTEWHTIIVWGPQAEVAAKYCKKGMLLYVEGKLNTRSWQAENGENKYTTEIRCINFQFLESKSDGQSNRPPMPDDKDAPPSMGKVTQVEQASMPAGDDDLPF